VGTVGLGASQPDGEGLSPNFGHGCMATLKGSHDHASQLVLQKAHWAGCRAIVVHG